MSAAVPSCLRVCRYALENKGSLCRGFYRHIVTKKLNPEFPRIYSYNFSTQPEDKRAQSSSDSHSSKDEEPPKETPKEVNQLEELNKTIAELTKQRDDFNDKYKRALADGENMRKRLMKQIDEAKIYGIQSFCKDLLEVADVLSKATECVPKEEVTDSNPHLKNLYEGLIMTEAQLQKVFKRHGLNPLNPIDEKFDPNFHEALFQQEVEGKTPGTIVVVSKIGYKLHDRVVRPALVGVAKG